MMDNKEAKAGMIKGSADWIFNLSSDEKPLSKMRAGDGTIIKRGYKGIIYGIISIIAQDVSKTEWKIYRGEDEAKETKLHKLLEKPNPLMSFSDMLELTQIFLELVGNAYWWLAKDKLGVIREIWVIPSQYIKPVPKIDEMGVDFYQVYGMKGIKRFEADEIVQFKYPNPLDLYNGMGTLEKALLEYDIHNFSKQYVMNFYKNGAIPQGILSTKEKLNERDARRIEDTWKQKYQGIDQSWEIAVLWGGFEYQSISLNPATERFIEQGNWTRNDLCAIFKVPPSKLGFVEDVNRANAEANNYTYMENCISPKLSKIENTINSFLVPKVEKGLEFKFEDVVPENIELEMEKEKINIQKANIGAMTGVLSMNEIRELLGFEPTGESGNKMVSIAEDAEEIERLMKALGYKYE